MISAYQGLLQTRAAHPGVPDLRIAAFLTAIHKVARSYAELGIFPDLDLDPHSAGRV